MGHTCILRRHVNLGKFRRQKEWQYGLEFIISQQISAGRPVRSADRRDPAGTVASGNGAEGGQPDDPLQGEGVREITVLKLGENLEQLNTISVPSGGQAKSTEPNDKASETRPEETQPDSSTDDGATVRRTETRGRTAGKFLPRSCRWS